jgi:hypothetical protein
VIANQASDRDACFVKGDGGDSLEFAAFWAE